MILNYLFMFENCSKKIRYKNEPKNRYEKKLTNYNSVVCLRTISIKPK